MDYAREGEDAHMCIFIAKENLSETSTPGTNFT